LPNSAFAVSRPRRFTGPERFELAAAAQLGLVDDVVVQQRRGVDELDGGRELEALGSGEAERPREQQHQHRPDALAAGADDVVRDLVDQGHIRSEPPLDDGVHLLHVGGHQRCGDGARRGMGGGRRRLDLGLGGHGRDYRKGSAGALSRVLPGAPGAASTDGFGAPGGAVVESRALRQTQGLARACSGKLVREG
jgi:hypothetical protein